MKVLRGDAQHCRASRLEHSFKTFLLIPLPYNIPWLQRCHHSPLQRLRFPRSTQSRGSFKISWEAPMTRMPVAEAEHLVEFNTNQPPLRKLLPGLPWQTTPGHSQVRLPYLLVSFVTWALFVLHETAASLHVDSYVLSPQAMQRAWNRVVALGFPLLELTMCPIFDKLGSFVATHPHTDFELRNMDLTATEAPSSLSRSWVLRWGCCRPASETS